MGEQDFFVVRMIDALLEDKGLLLLVDVVGNYEDRVHFELVAFVGREREFVRVAVDFYLRTVGHEDPSVI
jgi:hypothetical protein